MTQRAYHDFDHRSQEQLALKHFYRLLDADMKVKCIENRCNNILDAVYVVERYEALYADRKESKRSTVRAVEVQPDAATMAMQRIIEELNRLAARQDRVEEQSRRIFKSTHATSLGEKSPVTYVVRRDITDPTVPEGWPATQETMYTVRETFTHQTERPRFGGTAKACTSASRHGFSRRQPSSKEC